MDDEKSKYYSRRVRVADVTSPKNLVGCKEMTVEITFGNQETIIIKNPKDVAEIIKDKKIFDEIEEIYKERDAWALMRKFKFLDQLGLEPKPFD